MVRKRLKILLRKNLAKYLLLGIFSMSFLYPFFPSSPPKNKPSSINFESSIFSSEITSSVNGISTSLDVDSQGANVSISRNKSQIKFATPLTDASISHSLNEVTYKVPDNNVELRYKLLENGLKEDIVLHKIPQENIFKSNLITKNLTFKISQNGTPVFYDPDGQYQFHVQQPYAVDASGAITYSLKYFLLEKPNTKNEYILALEIDEKWLHDSTRVLPITIDPTIVHDTYAEFTGGSFNRTSNINDTLVLSSTNVTAANGYTYVKALSDNTTISTGDRFEYDVFITNNTTNVGSIDIKYTDASYARSSGWLDENGVGCSAGNLSSYAYNQWFHRACIFNSTDNGKTLSYIDLVNELNTNIGVTAYYDNFVIKDSNGNIKSTIYTNGAPTFNVIDIASNAGNTGTVVVSNSLSDPLSNIETNYQENTSDIHTVGLWHMNEASGNLLDSSGNGNTGVPTGTTVTPGLLGNARTFNGTSDYITVPNSVIDRNEVTVEAWVQLTDNTGWRKIFSHGSDGSDGWGIDIGVTNSSFYGRVVTTVPSTVGYSFYSSVNCTLNTWYHVAFTFRSGEIILYIDGQEIGRKTTGSVLRGTNTNYIGASDLSGSGMNSFWKGLIDEVRISNIARSSEEIKMSASRRPYSTYTSPLIDFNQPINSWNSFSWTELKVGTGDGETISDSTGLIAQWNFNETSNVYTTTPAGSCGSNCIGTLNNFNTYTQDDVPSAVGGTLTVTGNYNVHTFKAGITNFNPGPVYLPIEMLLIGGGGGGANAGSGGGAGGYLYTPRRWLNSYQYLYDIKVGVGGSGGATTSASGTVGGDTELYEDGSVAREAKGGGYGVSHGNSSGGKGASGGGGPIRTGPPFSTGGLNTQGNLGGAGYVESGWTGNSGGGGGAGGMGMSGGNVAGSGNGGIGLTSSITGTNTWYSGGGGGGEINGSYVGVGGSGGGGTAVINAAGGNGTDNTGGGGAGGSYNSGTYFNGGNGGSGIGIIRYQNIQSGWTSDRRWGGGAIKFDGIDDYVRTAGSINYAPTTTSSFTAETWVKFNQSTSSQAIIQTEDGTGTGRVLLGILNTNNVYSYIGGVQLTSNTKLNPGTWYHLAVVYNGSGETIYINGRADASASNIVEPNSAQITLGANKNTPPPSGYLSGIMDSTRIYSRALSAEELISNYNAGNIEFQTRVGDSTDPNDGTWEDWSPSSNENVLHSFETAPDFSPISYWTLNESIGTSISDSRSSNHGLAVGATISLGKFDIGRSLAGTGYVSIPDHSSLDITGDFTISAWVNASGAGNRQIISKTGTSGTGGYAILLGSLGEIYCRTDNGSSYVDSYTASGWVTSSTGWTHVTASKSGTQCRMYVNGVDRTTVGNTHSTNSANSLPLVIGARADLSTEFFAGGIDEIRVYDKSLSATQVSTLYQSIPIPLYQSNFSLDSLLKFSGTNSLKLQSGSLRADAYTVGLWHLDETNGTGAYIKDSSAYSNHGTPTGTSLINGVSNKARYFNNSTDQISLGNLGITDNRADITIEAWIYSTTSDASHHRVFTENNVIYVGQYGTQAAFYLGNGTGWDNSSYTMGNIPLNQWVHVAWVKSGTSAYVYINGQLTGFMAAPSTLGTSSNTNYISGQGSTQRWGGSIDEIRVSNIARNAEEIAESYRLGRDQYLNIPLTSSDLSTKKSLPFYIAANRPGSYLTTTIGESPFANYQSDSNTVGLWHLDDNRPNGPDYSATGGTITTSGAYTIHTFTVGGTFTPNGPLSVEYLIVGGGGGGGFSQNTIGAAGGGGGAGGFRTGNSSVNAGAFPVVVGGGGGGSSDASTPGGTGGASSFNSIVSNGGGGGGVRNTSATTGGSGGGGASKTMTTGAAGTAGQGNSGGNGDGSTLAGGGGGSSSAGSGRAGGAGTSSSISGSAVTYGVGGSGGRYLDDGPTAAAVAGTTNRGNGGGAGTSMYENSINGAAGGSGIVIIRYLTDNSTPIQTRDESGNGNHGTFTGTTFTEGKLGKARLFNGTSDFVSVADNPNFDIGTSDFTFSFWTKHNALSTYNTYLEMGLYTAGVLIRQDSPNYLGVYIQYAGTGDSYGYSFSPIVGQWYHIVLTRQSGSLKLYINGQQLGPAATSNQNIQVSGPMYIGHSTHSGASQYLDGYLDEVRIDRTYRTAEEIRQAYDIGSRTHQVTIDFGAKLVGSNLITNSADYSFNIDSTTYGIGNSGGSLYLSDRIIVKENIGGTEYVAQGIVNSVNNSTGAITVSSWLAGSTFPSGGFTVGADVFKWQREYFSVTRPHSEQINNISSLTLRVTDGNESRDIWVDDLRSAGSYLTNSIGSTITSSLGHRYFQYRSILTSHDYAISPSFAGVTSDYVSNESPTLPTLIVPVNIATTQSLTPTFKTVSTDSDGDSIQYEIKICTDSDMTANCLTFDQTSSNIGWSGMNVGTSAFSSGTTATYILQAGSSLAYNSTYYWKTRAIDTSGSNTWSNTQTTPFSFTTDTTSSSPTTCTIDQTSYPGSYLVKWTDTSSDESGFEIYRLKNGVGTIINTTSANAVSYSDTDIQPGNTYAYRIRAKKTATGGTFAYSPYCDTTQLSPATNNFLLEGLRLEGLQLE